MKTKRSVTTVATEVKENDGVVRSESDILNEMEAQVPDTNQLTAMVSDGAMEVASTEKLADKGIINRISDNGEINLSRLTEQEIKESLQFGKKLDVHDITSVSSYGADLQKVMNDNSKKLLSSSSQAKLGDETKEVINEMMTQLNNIDLDEIKTPSKFKRILAKIPVLRKLVFSVEKMIAKYDTIEQQVQKCQERLEAAQMVALRDNTMLQGDFDDTIKYIKVLEKLIIAAKIKSNEMEAGIATMKSQPEKYSVINIQDMESYKHELDKKVRNMLVWRLTFTQSLFRIREIQRTNISHASSIQETVQSMMPMLRQQLSQAIALYNLNQGVKAKNAVVDGFNKILTQNADAAHDLAIEVAQQNEQSSVTMETLTHNQERLMATMTEVKRIYDDAEKKFKEDEQKVVEMHRQLDSLILGTTPDKTITAESIEAKYIAD